MPAYYAQVRPGRIAPGELPFALGIQADPAKVARPVGVAFPRGQVGEGQQAEAAWRLVVGGVELDGRWVLRDGRFVEVAEGAE